MSNEEKTALVLPDGIKADPTPERLAEQVAELDQVAAEVEQANAELARLERMVFENYVGFCQQAGAILTLMASMPLGALLAACKRKQRVGILTLPQGTTPEQAVALGAQLRNDERIFTLMVELQRVYQQIATGRPA